MSETDHVLGSGYMPTDPKGLGKGKKEIDEGGGKVGERREEEGKKKVKKREGEREGEGENGEERHRLSNLRLKALSF